MNHQQAASSASKTDEILNKQLEQLVRLYGDLTLQREDIDSKLLSCRADIMRLQAVAPVCMQVEQETIAGRVSAAPPVALGPVLPIPQKKPEAPRKKRGRKSNAERAAMAAAAASAVKTKPNGAHQLSAN